MAVTINGTTGISLVQDGTITSAKIADSGVTSAKIADGTVAADDLHSTLDLSSKTLTIASSASSGIAKAWVNFVGTGTVAINESFNVSSITDNSTGNYSANFTTAMTDENYAFTVMSVVGTAGYVGNDWVGATGNVVAGSFRFQAGYRQSSSGSGAVVDSPLVAVTIFR